MARTYKVVRHFRDRSPHKRKIKSGLTLEQAQAHCDDPESAFNTCVGTVGKQRTEKFGPWFDGYYEE